MLRFCTSRGQNQIMLAPWCVMTLISIYGSIYILIWNILFVYSIWPKSSPITFSYFCDSKIDHVSLSMINDLKTLSKSFLTPKLFFQQENTILSKAHLIEKKKKTLFIPQQLKIGFHQLPTSFHTSATQNWISSTPNIVAINIYDPISL
jgi:hypothetical protein